MADDRCDTCGMITWLVVEYPDGSSTRRIAVCSQHLPTCDQLTAAGATVRANRAGV